MSTAQALQTVTHALRNRLKTIAGTTPVSTLPPHLVDVGLGTSPFLNLFLFEVLPNPALRNQELPPRGGGAVLRPPLPLDLRYLLTAFPDTEDEAPAHGLLGAAMLRLHDDPVLSRIELAGAVPAGEQSTGVELQVEQVKACLMHLPLDELSKLWTAFGTGYRLSVVYQLSVVLIDPGTPPVAPLPVLRRGDRVPPVDGPPDVGTGAGPVLDAVEVPLWRDLRRTVPARHGDTLAIKGRGLGATTDVRFRHPDLPLPIDVAVASAAADEITVVVPAGMPVGFGTIAAITGPAGRLVSNRLPLGVAPRITAVPVLPAPAGGPVGVDVTVTPPPAAPVPVVVLAGGLQLLALRTGPGSYRVDVVVPAGATPANQARLPVRARIEGIDSVPLADPDPDPAAPLPVPLDWDDAQVVLIP